MKKISVFVCVVLIITLSFPVVSFASGEQVFKVKTVQSVQGFYSDPDLNTIQQRITNYNYQTSSYNISRIYNALDSFSYMDDNFNKYIVRFYSSAGFISVRLFDSSKFDEGIFFVADNTTVEGGLVGTTFFGNQVFPGESIKEYVYVFNQNRWSLSSTQNNNVGLITESGTSSVILDSNIPVYSRYDITNKGGIYSEDAQFYFSGKEDYTNFLSPSLPFTDSEGETVTPEPEVVYEGNNNHMYFKDCEIGFCYPKSSPAPVSFGGAYFYIKYQVDDWIVNHISDYSLVFYADAEVGNEVTNTIRYEVALDPDGCITIPFSRVWTSPLTSKGFSVLVTDREIEDNFYKAYLYSLSPSGFVDFGNKAASSNQNSISGALNALTSGGIQSFLYYINGDQIDFYSAMSDVATSIATKYNPFLITAFTLLTDGTDNSGLFEMEFDLVAGTEDVTDTGGLVNPDPFVPDDDPDYTPSAPTPGNSTTPGYNIVPSGYWQGTINGVIGYDPGYRDLKSDLDKDPDGNFTQYLDPMKNQTVGSWFLSFVNDMPSEMKALLITGTGVGIFFGIYRFIRRG